MRKAILEMDGKNLPLECLVAESTMSRFLGLMGKKSMDPNSVIYFPKCNSIHTFFMRFPIDVVMIDKEGTVVKVFQSLRPWRMLWPVSKAKHTIELASEKCEELGITEGTHLRLERDRS